MNTPASLADERAWALPAIVDRLRVRFTTPLPGLDAQRLMAPVPRAGWQPTVIPEGLRKAAALLLIYPRPVETHLALTLRASHLLHHGGQVSLPGGAVEAGESIQETAVREAFEEIGIAAADATVLGQLTPLHIPVSGFVLHPVVACATSHPRFVPHEREVARVLEAPLAALCDPLCVRLRLRRHEGRDYEVPYFLVNDEIVWGATAMVLAEFLALLGHAPFRPAAPAEGAS